MLPLLDPKGVPINLGRYQTFLTGIQGVASPGVATVQVPTNRRIHSVTLQCVAVNYTGGVGLATTKLTGNGNNNLTVTPTVVNGVITAVAVVAGGTGYTTGDTITITDATGTGFVGTVTAAGGVVSAVAITSVGTASPINPATLISLTKHIVNGVSMRDISPQYTMMIAQANNINPALGDLPFIFSEEWRNFIASNDANSWDLAGQSTYEIDITINAGFQQVGITGIVEWDFRRNLLSDGATPFLEPVAQHLYSYNIPAGMTPITTLPKAYPIVRNWFIGSTPGNLTQIEVLQDGQKILESYAAPLKSRYQRNGFQFGMANYLNQNQTSAKPLGLNPINYWDLAAIYDNDQRYSKALKCKNTYEVRIWSAIAQTLYVLQETLPGAYQS